MEDFRKGNQPAFKKVYDLFYSPLCYFAYKMILNKETAQDIASDTLSKLWTRREHFDTLINIRAFLYITTRNQCLDFLRFSKKEKTFQEDLYYSLSNEKEDIIVERIVKAEYFEEIRQAIENLPTKRKTIFKLFYLEGLSVDEIARKLRMNPNTVSTSKRKAIAQLRNILNGNKLEVIVALIIFKSIVGN